MPKKRKGRKEDLDASQEMQKVRVEDADGDFESDDDSLDDDDSVFDSAKEREEGQVEKER